MKAAAEVAALVRTYLARHTELTIPVEVLDGKTSKDGEWWHVGIRALTDQRPFVYYDVLAEVEGEIEENEHLNIMLVPTG